MAGRPRGATKRDEVIRVRVTRTDRDVVDAARGSLTMSDYLRSLIAKDVREKGL